MGEKIYLKKGDSLTDVIVEDVQEEISFTPKVKMDIFNQVYLFFESEAKKRVPRYRNRLYRAIRAKFTKKTKFKIEGDVAIYGVNYGKVMEEGHKAPYDLSDEEIEGPLKKWVYDKIVKVGKVKSQTLLSLNKKEQSRSIAWLIADKFYKKGIHGRDFMKQAFDKINENKAYKRLLHILRNKT